MEKLKGYVIYYILVALQLIKYLNGQHVYSVPDVMMFGSNDLIYFHVIQPRKVSYVFKARLAQDFGNLFNIVYNKINLIPVEPPLGCKELQNKELVSGSIALVERGDCSFLSKAKNAEDAGAVGVLIADYDFNNDRVSINMVKDGTDRNVNIPAGFMLAKDSKHIKDALKEEGMPGAVISIPVNVTTSPELFMKQPPWSYW